MSLAKHINHILGLKIAYTMFEDFIIKYAWSAVGLGIGSIPIFFPDYAGSRMKRSEQEMEQKVFANTTENSGEMIDSLKTGIRTQGFITNKRLMLSLADAGGRVMYAYKELAELAGHTSRVYEMLSVFEDLKLDKYATSDKIRVFEINECQGAINLGSECFILHIYFE